MGQQRGRRRLRQTADRHARSAHAVRFAGLFQDHERSDSAGPRFPHDRCPRRAEGLHRERKIRPANIFKDGNRTGPAHRHGRRSGTKLDIEIVGMVRDTKYESMREEVPVEVYPPVSPGEFRAGDDGLRPHHPPAGAGVFVDSQGGEQSGSQSAGLRYEDARKAATRSR